MCVLCWQVSKCDGLFSLLKGHRKFIKPSCWLTMYSIKSCSFLSYSSYCTLTSTSISGCMITGQTAVGLTSPDLEVPASSVGIK